MNILRKITKTGLKATKLPVVIVAVAAAVIAYNVVQTHAATSGQMKLYFHTDEAETSSLSSVWGTLALTAPDFSSDLSPSTSASTTNVNATPPTTFCASSDGAGPTYNAIPASAASTGNRCIATFISMPVGQTISMTTSDTASITGQLWSSESATQVTAALNTYLYRWNGVASTLTSTDRIATLTCADPGTSATSCVPTAVAPANNISFAATDRIVAIISINVTASRSGASVKAYFDSTARTAASITMGYTVATANKPSLAGSMDDDFTTALASSSCTTGGLAVNTKWTCLQGTASGSTGKVDEGALTGTVGGDSSGWIKLTNSGATTPSDFGTTPSNTFLYQPLPGAYNSGTISTVVNVTNQYNSGSAPYSHGGLVLWASNTDYLEIESYYQTGFGGPNCFVSLNISGTISASAQTNLCGGSGPWAHYQLLYFAFQVNNGSYQPQYSTDGVTWNNLGSAISHAAFTRAGLNAYNAGSGYGAAFEWFHAALTSPSYSQISYRWFANADSTVPGSPFTAAQNTPYYLTSKGEQFRLRILLSETGQTATGGDSFNLQYAPLGSSANCSAVSSGSWTGMSAGGSWTQGTAAAGWSGREYFGLVNFNNKLWLLGGADSVGAQSDVWSSSDGINWTQETASAPWGPRKGLGALVFNNKIWIFGGHDGTNYKNDVWSSSDGVNWTQATAAAGWTGRQWMGTTVYNSKMWVMGGYDSVTGYVNDVWSSSDGITWTQATAAAGWAARATPGVTVMNNKMWIATGVGTSATEYSDVWSSTDGITWTLAASSPFSSRSGAAVVTFGGKLWVLGGYDGSFNLQDVWSSSDGTTWTQATSSAPWGKRDYLGAVVLGNNLWIMGGVVSGYMNDTWYTSLPLLSYYDNPTPAGGSNIASNANDPTDSGQTVAPETYVEGDGFSNSQAAFGGTTDAEWDISLYDNGAPQATTYCLRVVKSDGSVLGGYTNYPMISTYGPTQTMLMRGGMWFDGNGNKQSAWWSQ